ncbi:DUF7311 family protein [Halopiger xanaduensis]|uniref:DUF7311 domain-containing protein n=1 Tax=Halopiger xanaduensis (strain DSM 18323 / JCM 14033 / SH-6) TaxID=797210 RepID=F8D4U0_HALXS|nr:hypothetical protein [Halopiger xanaduensis]AEH37561.1 hypothetical protein Halxa_2945 [Halopiger xanaduensis SH-6]
MIRYVVAVLLTLAIFGLAGLAIDDAAGEATERELRSELAAVEAAAVDLEASEEVSPAGHPNPRRVVEFSVPTRSLTRAGVDRLEIEPVADDASVARYVLTDGTRGRMILESRLVYCEPTADRTTEIGWSGTKAVRLALRPDADGRPVVVATFPDS